MTLLVYESWRLDYPEVVYTYRWDGGTERVTLGLGAIPEADLVRVPQDGLANLLAHAGVAFARYLLPLAGFEQLHVEPLALPPRAIAYFERTLRRGLAEMRYRNGLDVTKPFHVTASPFAPSYAPAPLAGSAVLRVGRHEEEAKLAHALALTWHGRPEGIEKKSWVELHELCDVLGRTRHNHG